MNKILCSFFFWVLTCHLFGQEISVESFASLDNDITANSNGTTVYDLDGEKCALIKIETGLTSLTFDVGVLGVVETRQKIGEIWVYVPAGVKSITITHPHLGVIRDYSFGMSLGKAKTYLLKLVEKGHDLNSQVVDKLRRKVLLSLKKNEELLYNECMLSLSVDGDHFACTIVDTLLNKQSFIIDGVKKISNADLILCHYIDPSNYDNCIIQYSQTRQGNGVYSTSKIESIYIEGKTYGPYIGEIEYLYPQYAWFGIIMNDSQPIWLTKNRYEIRTYSDRRYNYQKYISGEEYSGKKSPFGLLYRDGTVQNDSIISVNQKYVITTNEPGTLYINNKKFTFLPRSEVDKWNLLNCAILDDGRCFVECANNNESKKLLIHNNDILYLKDEEYLNFRTGTIDIENNINNGYYIPSVFADVSQYKGDTTYHDDHIVYDKSGSHYIESIPKYKFVTIDNKEYGKECALGIWYKESTNSFVWTSLEENELVMYEYIL